MKLGVFCKNKKRTAMWIAVAAVLLAAVTVFFVCNAGGQTFEHKGFAMGSQTGIVFYGRDRSDIAQVVFDEIAALDTEKISSKSEKSEIYTLNENGCAGLSEEALGYVKKAYEICEKSDGALDITVGRLSTLWDFDSGKNEIPEKSQIDGLLAFVGYNKISFDGYNVTIGENQAVEFGAVGKGLACDKAKEVLDKNGVEKALVTVGGTVMTYTSRADGEKNGWNVGIRTPDADDFSAFMKIYISDTKFISTSGNYEKFFERDGKVYHHILDTSTGFPVENELKSVTVVADCGFVSDALSTACFVLGREKSAYLLDEYGAQAVFVDENNKVYITDGIADKCTILNDAYTVVNNE